MGKKWVFNVLSPEEFLDEQRRAHIPEEVIKRLDEMSPLAVKASGDEAGSLPGSFIGAVNPDDSVGG